MSMYVVRPLGCCFGAVTEDGLDPDTVALLTRHRAAQQVMDGGSTVTVPSPTDPPPDSGFPWGKLLAVSVGAGLVLHYVTKRGRR
jgi:hypothetical protein